MRAVSYALLLVHVACGSPPPPHPDAAADAAAPGNYELTAIRPAVAMAGATITLDGTFAADATVTFPGAASVAATVDGPHRAHVTVPAGATTGNLMVVTGAQMLPAIPFRTTAFALGLIGPDDQYDFSRQRPSLVTPRAGHASVVVGTSIYVIGGTTTSSTLSSVERAAIDQDGSLQPFSTAATVLVTSRTGHTANVIGGFVYVVGGTDGVAALASVERAPINADGSLGAFAAVAGVQLASPRIGHTSAVIGDGLYVLGGTDGTNALNTVERAEIQPDGSLGAFAIVDGAQLTAARSGHASVVIGNFLYDLGGQTSAGVSNAVEVATIYGDGTISTFTPVAGLTLPSPATGLSALVLGDYLYLVGGKDGTAFPPVALATIHDDGSLGAFSTFIAAPFGGRYGHTAEVVGNHVYVIGGNNGALVSSLQIGSIDLGGTFGTFSPSQVSLDVSRTEHASVVIGKYLYLIGGSGTSASATVSRVTMNPDGSLSSLPTVDSATLTTGRHLHTAAVIGNYVYVFGGSDAGNSPLGSVERAAINPDGSLGNFANAGVSLVTPRTAHTTAVLGNAVFVFGGAGTAGTLNSVERAVINADGSLGAFAAAGTLVTARSAHSQLVYSDGIWLIGGDNSTGNPLGSIETAGLTTDASGNASLTAFSTAPFALATVRAYHASFQIGPYAYVVGGNNTTSIERYPGPTLETFQTLPGASLSTLLPSVNIVGNNLYLISGTIQQAGLQ